MASRSVVVCDISGMDATVKEIDPTYMSGSVVWNDGARGVVNGQVSSFGSNITDARLEAQDGGFVPFVRPENRIEQLGVSTSDQIHLVDHDGTPLTLDDVLEPKALNERVAYMGYKSVTMTHQPKRPVVLRFQHAFVGLNETGHRSVVPTHYSYQTQSRDNPKNLILLATSQGITVQCDDAGMNKLFAHDKDESGNTVNKWFDVEATRFAVGQSQSDDEPPNGKKSKSTELVLKGMGPRANCFAIINIACKQKPKQSFRGLSEPDDEEAAPVYRSLCAKDTVCRSARVSYGTTEGATALNEIDLVVDDNAPIVITVLCYNTVENPVKNQEVGIPKDSIRLAVEDMKRCLSLCIHSCKLSELAPMLHKLTEKDKMECIEKKRVDPIPPSSLPAAFLPNPNALDALA